MTESNLPPQDRSGWQPPADKGEAKARAKAEKAYRKASRPWYKKKRFLLPLALVAIIVIVSVSNTGGGGDDTVVGGGDARGANCTQTYPDQQETDRCADANGLVTLGGVEVTAKNFRRVSDGVGGKEICTDVSLVNKSDESKDFNVFDYKLQTPDGEVKSFELTLQSTLSSGVIISGGKKAGRVCFTDVPAKGQFVFIYKPAAFSSDRGIWLFKL
jgi:hypothetical protein